ncbi:MAG TPA: polysaccharide biosynthesis/export family protein [Blastocatellia bacterium]
MNTNNLMSHMGRFGVACALIVAACALQRQQSFAQTPAPAAAQTSAGAQIEDDSFFRDIYREFYDTYRLGPADEIAIRVTGQPDYTLDRVKISPAGRVYHPLLGDLEVAGMTVPRLIDRLTKEMAEFLIAPKVSVSLLEANSAKIGVLGDVIHPGIVIMNKPMSVLEAITASGGISDSGSKSGVIVLRQTRDGRAQTFKVNVKRILEGKAGPEENIPLHAGDTVIVNGNTKKKVSYILSLAGFASFLSFVSGAGR